MVSAMNKVRWWYPHRIFECLELRRNYNMSDKKVGRTFYDHVDNPKAHPTTWEYIVKADALKQVSLAQLDKNGG